MAPLNSPSSPTNYRILKTRSGSTVYFKGPEASLGPLPALFYFALSGEESLCLDPYNQIAAFLSDAPLRIYSLTLPWHGKDYDHTKAMAHWAHEVELGSTFIREFVNESVATIHDLTEEGWIEPGKIAVSGLSRGGFIASHIAAANPKIGSLLAFAPLTQLSYAQHFETSEGLAFADALNVHHLVDKLIHTHVRFYIGNRDLRVGTELSFQFIRDLAKTAYEHHIRSPQAELIISPSIGHKGHGTAPGVFLDGANWIKRRLLNLCQ
jgi:dienelactone hydrolase